MKDWDLWVFLLAILLILGGTHYWAYKHGRKAEQVLAIEMVQKLGGGLYQDGFNAGYIQSWKDKCDTKNTFDDVQSSDQSSRGNNGSYSQEGID